MIDWLNVLLGGLAVIGVLVGVVGLLLYWYNYAQYKEQDKTTFNPETEKLKFKCDELEKKVEVFEALKDEAVQIKDDLQNKYETLKDKNKRDEKELKESYKEKESKLKVDFDKEKDSLLKYQDDLIKEIKKEHRAEVKELENQIFELEVDNDSFKKEIDKKVELEVKETKKEFDTEKKSLKDKIKELENSLELQEKENLKKINELEKKHIEATSKIVQENLHIKNKDASKNQKLAILEKEVEKKDQLIKDFDFTKQIKLQAEVESKTQQLDFTKKTLEQTREDAKKLLNMFNEQSARQLVAPGKNTIDPISNSDDFNDVKVETKIVKKTGKKGKK